MIADRPLYLASDHYTLLEEGAGGAAFLLACGEGVILDPVEVKRLNLEVVNGRVEQKAETEAPEHKAMEGPFPRKQNVKGSGSGLTINRAKRGEE